MFGRIVKPLNVVNKTASFNRSLVSRSIPKRNQSSLNSPIFSQLRKSLTNYTRSFSTTTSSVSKEEVVIHSNNAVKANIWPFNLLYVHKHNYLNPLDDSKPGKRPFLALSALVGVFTAILLLEAYASASLEENLVEKLIEKGIIKDADELDDESDFVEACLKLSPEEVRSASYWLDKIHENFHVNYNNLMERPWTAVTSSFMHSDFLHMAGNTFSLCVFFPKLYQMLGVRHFMGLYIAGAITCSLAHVGLNYLSGATERLPDFAGQLKVFSTEEENKHSDISAVGASGACMAIAAFAAMMFPYDKVVYRIFVINIPFVALLYMASDASGVLKSLASLDGGDFPALNILSMFKSKSAPENLEKIRSYGNTGDSSHVNLSKSVPVSNFIEVDDDVDEKSKIKGKKIFIKGKEVIIPEDEDGEYVIEIEEDDEDEPLIGHIGHLGGILGGIMYALYIYYGRRIGGLTMAQKYKAPIPISSWIRKKTPASITFNK